MSKKNAQELMFEEHEVYGDEMLIDEKVGYEDLRDYLFQPSDIRRKTEMDSLNDNRIQEMIKISTVKEDVTNPFAPGPSSQLSLQDTVEYQKMKMDKMKMFRAEREKEEKNQEKLDALQRFGQESDVSSESLEESIQSGTGGNIGMISKKKSKEAKTSKGGKGEKEMSLAEEGEEGAKPVDEKKKILEFIKKANEKKVKGSTKN